MLVEKLSDEDVEDVDEIDFMVANMESYVDVLDNVASFMECNNLEECTDEILDTAADFCEQTNELFELACDVVDMFDGADEDDKDDENDEDNKDDEEPYPHHPGAGFPKWQCSL